MGKQYLSGSHSLCLTSDPHSKLGPVVTAWNAYFSPASPWCLCCKGFCPQIGASLQPPGFNSSWEDPFPQAWPP